MLCPECENELKELSHNFQCTNPLCSSYGVNIEKKRIIDPLEEKI